MIQDTRTTPTDFLGKLKVALVGSNRFDVFSLVEKDDKSMTLKGKFGGYYYFIKK